MKKRVIVVYEKAGGGHYHAALILREMLTSEEVEVTIMTPLEMIGYPFENPFTSFFVNYFRKLDMQMLSDIVFNFLFRIFVQPWFISFGTPKFVDALVEKHRPDVLVSTISGLNPAFELAAEKLEIPFRIFITVNSICTDMLCRNSRHLCYFEDTKEVIRSFPEDSFGFQPIRRFDSFPGRILYPLLFTWHHGIAGKKFSRDISECAEPLNSLECFPVGIVRKRAFYQSPQTRPAEIRGKLGIPTEKECILLNAGSLGGKFIEKTLKRVISTIRRPLTILALCGTDDICYQRIEQIGREAEQGFTIVPLHYVDKMEEYLRASDLVVTRGTSGAFLESILTRTPSIIRSRIDKWDQGNLTLLKKYELGETFGSGQELCESIEIILENREHYVQHIEDFIRLTKSGSYDEVATRIRLHILDTGTEEKSKDRPGQP